MNGPIFVDTNLLVYSRDSSEAIKQKAAAAWMSYLWDSRLGRLSFQVLHEYYITVTRKLTPGLSREQARSDVRDLLAWNPVQNSPAILDIAWAIEDRYRLSWWDALIAGSALVSGCRILLTEDLQHEMFIENLRLLNPFRVSPESLDAPG